MKLTKQKKAQMYFIAQLVIAVLSFILLSMTISKFVNSQDSNHAEEICQKSIAFRALTTLQVNKKDISLSPRLCKTIDKEIEGDRDEIKEDVAKLMSRCWWMFNEGRYDDVLSKNKLKTVMELEDSDSGCFICYSAVIEEDKIDDEYTDGPITASEMYEYLKWTNYPKIKNATYLEYIQSKGGGPGVAAVLDQIRPRSTYAITYLSKSKDDSGWSVADTAAVGAVGVGFACAFFQPCGLIALIGTLAVGGAGAGYLGVSATDAVTSKFFSSEERDVSMVVLSSLQAAQRADCGSTDAAGK